MNEELSYAEMLEIPVETVTVNRREKKRRAKEDIAEQVVDTVNDRVESSDPAYAESRPIEREAAPDKRTRRARRILWGEFAAACVLCATIFLTNIFMTDSAINTFVRGLWSGDADTADTRTYQDFTLSPVVNQFSDVELTVSDQRRCGERLHHRDQTLRQLLHCHERAEQCLLCRGRNGAQQRAARLYGRHAPRARDLL